MNWKCFVGRTWLDRPPGPISNNSAEYKLAKADAAACTGKIIEVVV